MQNASTAAEIRGDRQGKVGAVVGLILVLLLLMIPLFFTELPKPGQPGILVNLGMIDLGQGAENAGPSAPETPPPPREVEETPQEVVPPPPPPPSAQPEPAPVQREVVLAETPQQIALRKQKAREEAKRKADAEQKRREQDRLNKEASEQRQRELAVERERQRKLDAEEARKRKEAADARAAKEAADAAKAKREAEAAATRNRVGGLFGGGEGRGETGTAGNQGTPDGDPNADRLKGVSTGDGRVSGGLGGRGVLNSPVVKESSQRPGRVVVDVCVGPDGSILSAVYTQAGSTTNDPNLHSAAINNAKKWRFRADPAAPERQCGKITYDFKVQ